MEYGRGRSEKRDQREHAVLLTGIGGQGVQLAAQVLGRAAIVEGLDVQLFGSYEGMMRGGSTQATLILAEATVESPPTVDRADVAVVMHHEHADDVVAKVATGGLILVNAMTQDDAHGASTPDRRDCTVLEVPAADIAIDLGHVMAASMVMTGVLAALTGLVSEANLAGAVADALPKYRSAHIDRNVAAIHAGFEWGTQAASTHAPATATAAGVTDARTPA